MGLTGSRGIPEGLLPCLRQTVDPENVQPGGSREVGDSQKVLQTHGGSGLNKKIIQKLDGRLEHLSRGNKNKNNLSYSA